MLIVTRPVTQAKTIENGCVQGLCVDFSAKDLKSCHTTVESAAAMVLGDPNGVAQTAPTSPSVEAGAFGLSIMWIDTIGRKRDDE
jgi:hypothetical protein